MKPAAWLLAFTLALPAPAAQASSCMQSNTAGQVVEGRLSHAQFEDAAGRPEQAFILTLPASTCLAGSDEMDNVEDVETIHVYAFDEAISMALKTYLGKDVQVRGTPFPAHTAHHHAPIVMEVREIDGI